MAKKIAITLGEPAGIGVELVCKLCLQENLRDCIVLGDIDLLTAHIKQNHLAIVINQSKRHHKTLNCLPISLKAKAKAGTLNKNNAAYVLQLLDQAANGCLKGEFSAMLTCPLHKGIINDAGFANFTGHTEYLAQLSQTKKVVMMLLNQHMRVALLTTHLPLKEVAAQVNTTNLSQTLHILIQDMQQKFALKNPKIAVCGLNPHAGEDGHLGTEEIEIINPVIKQFQKNHAVFGAIPADTLFTKDKLKNYDAVLAMYHDQGLAPLKYAGFGQSVNLTLGLPFIRTSVDHGTALDIAGKNCARIDSLVAALKLTRELVNHG